VSSLGLKTTLQEKKSLLQELKGLDFAQMAKADAVCV